MRNTKNSLQQTAPSKSIPYLDKEHGYYGSASVSNAPEEIYRFCMDPTNVEKVLANLPAGVRNFLQLDLISSEQTGPEEYQLTWQNNEKNPAKGTLTFFLKRSPFRDGSTITAEAVFEKIKFKEEGPSTLMNIFLKRMKNLMETGSIASPTLH